MTLNINGFFFFFFLILAHFSTRIQLIIHTKFDILGFFFMAPSQRLVLEPGAIFRGNMVMKVATLKEIYEHLNLKKIASTCLLLAVT